jgi:hypothetical protein
MRTLIVTTCLTLDGITQAPGGPEEDYGSGFAHGGWSVNNSDIPIALQLRGQPTPHALFRDARAESARYSSAASASSAIRALHWSSNLSTVPIPPRCCL